MFYFVINSYLSFLLIVIFCLGCTNPRQKRLSAQIQLSNCKELKARQTIDCNGVKVDIWQPDSLAPKGNIIILPGWNFSRLDWCTKTDLCTRALKSGYRLILPEMGKSIYVSKIYPETRADWRKFPTLPWLSDTLLSILHQEYCILWEGQNNFVMGLSTGGRGVAKLVLARPELFKAAAALSGDFDPTLEPNEPLCNGYLGPLAKFNDRWMGVENPKNNALAWKTPLYLGHGGMDKVVPLKQTQNFYEALKKQHPELEIKLNIPPKAGHDYTYWGAETEPVLAFFDKYCQN